jgi:hypothetical protein
LCIYYIKTKYGFLKQLFNAEIDYFILIIANNLR